MSDSPSQRWSSAVFALFACARGRLPEAFLDRQLADLGITGVQALPRADLQRFEQAVELVGLLIAGKPAPGGQKPEAALAAAFPDGHPTLTGLRPVAQAYVAAMRPNKKAATAVAEEPSRGPRERERNDRPRGDRDRGPRNDRPHSEPVRPPPAPRPPRIPWQRWLDQQLTPAVAPPAADPQSGAAAAPAPAPLPEVWVPPTLAHWSIDAEARRQLARIRDRVAAVIAAKAQPADAVRELAFALLRPPLGVRDDLRLLIADHLQLHGVTVSHAALFPPPALAALKRDWEHALAERGPADPAVEGAWKRMVEAHPEAQAKLEAERRQELEDLVRRFAGAAREYGPDDQRTGQIRARLEARHASAPERIAAELALIKTVDEAIAAAGQLVAARGWEDAEVLAALDAIAKLDPQARQHLEGQRRQEFEELDRRLRAATREHGPAGEATLAALERLRARFPSDGNAAATRLERLRRGDDIAQQERERRESGRSLSTVHLSGVEHRLPHLRPAPRWRLVIALTGLRSAKDGGDRRGQVVGWLISDTCSHGPVPAGWRASESGSLDELDACVQALVDREGGVLGLSLADCPVHGGGPWTDAAWAVTALSALVLPVAGPCAIEVELPAWAETTDPAFDQALIALAVAASGPQRSLSITRVLPAGDHAASLVEALAWSWSGRKDAEQARIRQSGLAGGCLLQPSAALRDTIAALGAGTLPSWTAWSALLAEAVSDPQGLAAALLERMRSRIAATPEAIQALHRHLTGQARGRIAEPTRLARELAWFDSVALALRPRDRLRLDGALLAAQAAAGRIDPATSASLIARLTALREDAPDEVLETALHAAAQAREAFDLETAEALLALWAKAEALACGGRTLLVRLCDERARIAASAGRWKEARKQLDRGSEAAARIVDAADREHALARLATLRAAVLADDTTVDDDEARAALVVALDGADPAAAATALASDDTHRHLHLTLLRWAVRRQDEGLSETYLAARPTWSEGRDATGGIHALRAVLLARTDPDAARALLLEAFTRLGDGAPASQRLALLACAVTAALHGAALPDLGARLAALRTERPAAAPAVGALERALTLLPDVRAGLAEALPLLAR